MAAISLHIWSGMKFSGPRCIVSSFQWVKIALIRAMAMAYGAIIVINSNKFIILFNCFDWNDEPFSIFVLSKCGRVRVHGRSVRFIIHGNFNCCISYARLLMLKMTIKQMLCCHLARALAQSHTHTLYAQDPLSLKCLRRRSQVRSVAAMCVRFYDLFQFRILQS